MFAVNFDQLLCYPFLQAAAGIFGEQFCDDLVQSQTGIVSGNDKLQHIPGKGHCIVTVRDTAVLVINLEGRVNLSPLRDPIQVGKALLKQFRSRVKAAIVDFHAEAVEEKEAVALSFDGEVSAVVGTHTHVPTADTMLLAGGTAYQTDIGMCGDYDSVIGMQKTLPVQRFVRKMPTERLTPADGPATLSGVFIETDDATGLAKRAAPLRVGGKLAEAWP